MTDNILIYVEGPNGCIVDEETCNNIDVATNIYRKLLKKYHQISECTIITEIGNCDFDENEEDNDEE